MKPTPTQAENIAIWRNIAEDQGFASGWQGGWHPNPYSSAIAPDYWLAWEKGYAGALTERGTPTGVQLHRVSGWKKPPKTTVVTRGTGWGNPFRAATVEDNVNAVGQYEKTLRGWKTEKLLEYLAPLRGQHLACFCRLGTPCHRDLLLKLCQEYQPRK